MPTCVTLEYSRSQSLISPLHAWAAYAVVAQSKTGRILKRMMMAMTWNRKTGLKETDLPSGKLWERPSLYSFCSPLNLQIFPGQYLQPAPLTSSPGHIYLLGHVPPQTLQRIISMDRRIIDRDYSALNPLLGIGSTTSMVEIDVLQGRFLIGGEGKQET